MKSPSDVYRRLFALHPPAAPQRVAGTAVVLGGSIAGLMAARVLADHCEQVVIVERDSLPDTPAVRKGVPQSQQLHGLLPGGAQLLELWFPGFLESVQRAGALNWHTSRTRYYSDDRVKGNFSDAEFITCTRPLLEGHIRKLVLRLPNVDVATSRATGLRFAHNKITGIEHVDDQTRTTSVIDADFLVDAMGRGSRFSNWLHQAGRAQPEVRRVDIDLHYSSALFPRTDIDPAIGAIAANWKHGRGPSGLASAFVTAVEHDQWLVLLSGYGENRPPADNDEFVRQCRALAPEFARAVTAPMIGDLRRYRLADSKWRLYSELENMPSGFVSVGDAVASLNPVYGQGMTSSCLHAAALSAYLRDDPDLSAPARAFFAMQAAVVDASWKLSAAGDLALPHVKAPRPRGYRITKWMTDQIIDASVTNRSVAQRFDQVFHMREHPDTLSSTRTVVTALWENLRCGRVFRRRVGVVSSNSAS